MTGVSNIGILPMYGIVVCSSEIYVGRISRNGNGDYINGFRVSTTELAEICRQLKVRAPNQGARDLVSSYEKGRFSFPKYALNGQCISLGEEQYAELQRKLDTKFDSTAFNNLPQQE